MFSGSFRAPPPLRRQCLVAVVRQIAQNVNKQLSRQTNNCWGQARGCGGGAAKVAEARQLSIAKAQSGKFWEGSPPLSACLPVLAAIGARALISLTRPTLRKVATAAH